MPLTTLISALSIFAAAALSLFEILTGNPQWAVAAMALVAFYILLGLRKTGLAARVMLGAAVAATAAYLILGRAPGALAGVASRAAYLPALITVLLPLRISAMGSAMVDQAGRFVVHQPPARRFALLATGGHVFGVLLNIGGLMLLLHVALRGPLGNPDKRVAQIQIRRITNAVLRGFGANIFWSPLGLGLNLLLTLVPALSWTEFLPYGLTASAVFMSLGWIFDRLQSPTGRQSYPKDTPGRPWGLLGLLAVLAAISGGASALETAFGLPLRGAILMIVPVFAIGWAAIARPTGLSPQRAIAALGVQTLRQGPVAVNEIAIIASAGYLGLVIALLIPNEAVVQFALLTALEGARLACVLSLLIFVTSIVGLNPMIAATVCVSAIVSAQIAIDPPLLLLSALTGWALALIVSPATSTVAITSSAAHQTPATIGLRWNGLFCLGTLAVAIISFLVFWP
ncbi:MAG: hypothetical protein CL814_02305 [Confluentimicrobium sp.]|uniref:hypothetical protein n=1 Tax=Actibacterium sp. TaxID=1872125 RepID=UPI000C3DE6E2|nr:hypothetical protein [Actibacterium sp.]MBC55745.1 hypothetical protein [Actibacterium sp.]